MYDLTGGRVDLKGSDFWWGLLAGAVILYVLSVILKAVGVGFFGLGENMTNPLYTVGPMWTKVGILTYKWPLATYGLEARKLPGDNNYEYRAISFKDGRTFGVKHVGWVKEGDLLETEIPNPVYPNRVLTVHVNLLGMS